jgi:hypothetical protein
MTNKPIPKAAQHWSFWQNMRQTSPSEYYQPSTQSRMVRGREILGGDAFYVAPKAKPKPNNGTFADPDQLDLFADTDGENHE